MKNNVLKNTIMLYGLSIAKIVFPLLTLPYLTRVLSVECYGVVAYVKSIMQYMQLAVDFGFMLSGTKDVVQVAWDKDKLGRVTGDILAARLLLSGACLIVVAVLVFALPILKAYKLYTLLAFGTVFLSVFLFDYLFRGLEKMQVITLRFVLMRAISTVITFLVVRGDGDVLWIPILDLLGSGAAIVLVSLHVKKLGIQVRFASLKYALQKLKDSAVYFMSNMATTAFGALNTLLIGVFLPAGDVAYWSVSMQLIGAVQTMYNPITDGIYPEMVKSKRLSLVKKTLFIVMPIILAGSAFCLFAGKYVLLIVGGYQYVAAETVFRLLVPVLIFSFPAMLIGWPTLGAIGKQTQVTKTTVITAIFQVLGLVLLIAVGHFTLISIAVLRCITELVLLGTRAYYCWKYRVAFVR